MMQELLINSPARIRDLEFFMQITVEFHYTSMLLQYASLAIFLRLY